MEWSQSDFALRLGVVRRTLVYWENGYWLPPEKERLHLVLLVGKWSPAHALAIAEAMALTLDPLAAPVLAFLRGAVEDAAKPRPARPTADALRAAVDGVVRVEADGLNVTANVLRKAVARVVGAASGATLEDLAVAVTEAGAGAR